MYILTQQDANITNNDQFQAMGLFTHRELSPAPSSQEGWTMQEPLCMCYRKEHQSLSHESNACHLVSI
jgi:hypothetical protein